MPEMISITREELANLQERARKLAMEKSYLQIINRMMEKLSALPGLENTVENMLRAILDTIGGTNLIVYAIDLEIYYADAFGTTKKIENIEDSQVKEVFEKRSVIEYEHDFSATLMQTPEFTRAWTWVVPLQVGTDLIGVLKMENLHLGMRDLQPYLPAFFNYAALILKNAVWSHSRLKKAYDELSLANAELAAQNDELERMNRLFVGRELRMVELKKKIRELEEK